jgi:hypothetical protein
MGSIFQRMDLNKIEKPQFCRYLPVLEYEYILTLAYFILHSSILNR